MITTIDAAGRIVVPKVATGRTAVVSDEGRQLVARGGRPVTDEQIYTLLDAGRR